MAKYPFRAAEQKWQKVWADKYLKEIMPNANYVSSKDYNLLVQNDVKKMFKDLKPEIVIHLAARVGGVHPPSNHKST